jgi:hypothetical protein
MPRPLRSPSRSHVLGALAALVVAGPASGLTLSYDGVITFVDDPGSRLDPAVTLGAAFSLAVTFDETTASLSGDQGRFAHYTVDGGPRLELSIGGTVLVNTADFIGIVYDSSVGIDTWNTTDATVISWPDLPFRLSYADSSGTLLSNGDFFVPSDTDFSGWTGVRVLFDYYDGNPLASLERVAEGTIFPAVPEPRAGPLLLVGLLLFLRRSARESLHKARSDGTPR